MSDLVLAPAVRQLELLRSGEVSVVELAEAHIRQIERLNPQLNAFADFDAESVRERARKHDAWRGNRSRRPLFGLPVTVKSSIATRGLKCEIGSLLHKGDVPREDALVVARLRPSRRGCRRPGWAATVEGRCACLRTSPASVRSSPHRAAFRAAATCRRAWVHSRFWVPSALWRVPWPTSR